MSGETEKEISGWTVDTLHQLMLTRISDIMRMLDERHANQSKALETAQTALEKRFDSVNEFRATLSDQASTFLPRGEYRTAHEALVGRVDQNAERMAALELRLTSRLDTSGGREIGAGEYRNERRLNMDQVVNGLMFLVIAAGTLFAILHG